MHRSLLLKATLIVAATVAVAGCPALTTSAPLSADVSSATDDAVTGLDSLSDLFGDSSSATAFLSSALEDSTGVGFATQNLRAVQDVTGNLATGLTFPQLFTSPSALGLQAAAATVSASGTARPAWLANGNTFTWVSPNKRWTTTKAYYVNDGAPTWKPPFGEESKTVDNKDSSVHNDEIASPEATASSNSDLSMPMPAIFMSASPSLLPANPLIRQATISFPVHGITDGHTNTAVGYRWVVNDFGTANPPSLPWGHTYSWIRALQVSRTNASGSVTVNHYDVATRYTAEPDPNHPTKTAYAPYEYISDDYNVTAKTDYHEDRIYSASDTTWTGKGTWTAADGTTRTTNTTWNDAATSGTEWTKTISWTNAKGHKVVMTLDYNTTYDGTGNINVDGTQVATLAWTSDFKGTATIKGNKVKSFRAPRP